MLKTLHLAGHMGDILSKPFPVDRIKRRGEHLFGKNIHVDVLKFKIKALRFHSLLDDDVIQTLTEECHRGKHVKLRGGDKKKKKK